MPVVVHWACACNFIVLHIWHHTDAMLCCLVAHRCAGSLATLLDMCAVVYTPFGATLTALLTRCDCYWLPAVQADAYTTL